MNRVIYVKGFVVVGCIVYDDAIPVKIHCRGCPNESHCIYKKIVFEED